MRRTAPWVFVVGLVACTAERLPGAMPPSDRVFPGTTAAFVSVGDTSELIDAWDRAPIGKLLADDAMQPFYTDLKRQLHEKGLLLEDRLGITMDELEMLPSGELAGALVRMPSGKGATGILIDVTGNEQAAGQALRKIDALLVRDGAKRSMVNSKFAKTPLSVYDIPPKGPRKQAIKAIYVIENGVLGIADDQTLMDELLSRLTAAKPNALADNPAYQNVMQSCEKQASDIKPNLRWWADPLNAGDAVQSRLPQKPSRDMVAIAKKEGFGAIRGVGGYVTLGSGQYGVLHRTKIFAPGPFQRSMRMLSLPNAAPDPPETWVTAKVASYMTFRWDMMNAFQSFGTLFDEIVGEGEEGVWNDVIDSMKTDPNGPQIDVEKELIGHLGVRCSILTDHVDPVGPHSQRRLFAAETKDEAKVAAAVDKLMQNDPSVKMQTINVDGVEHKIYEIVPEDQQVPELQVQVAGEAAQHQAGHGHAPHSAITVGLGYLLISSHVDLLEQILKNPNPAEKLQTNGDYQRIAAELTKLHKGPLCAHGFTRDDDRFYVTYELIRQGRLPEADVPLADALNMLFQSETPEGQVRQPKLDGSKLPEYTVVRKYLGLGGADIRSELDGWTMEGFTLNPGEMHQAARAAQPR